MPVAPAPIGEGIRTGFTADDLPSPSAWRTSEIAALRRLYPTGGTAACRQALPHRTPASIRARARMIGLARPRRNPLMQAVQLPDIATIARHLIGRSPAGALTLRQIAMIGIVCDRPGPHTVGSIAAALDVAKPVITRSVRRLTALGLIRWHRSTADRRLILIDPTDLGRQARDGLRVAPPPIRIDARRRRLPPPARETE
ncbi:MAG: MarR family transcriptional regulator [Sphingomonas sp.]|nr:MarR family transcriptional regulator [Sphingomonas sp.]MDX3883582.1 MarR family transcriptional regulator [Sphingomonas sp.]